MRVSTCECEAGTRWRIEQSWLRCPRCMVHIASYRLHVVCCMLLSWTVLVAKSKAPATSLVSSCFTSLSARADVRCRISSATCDAGSSQNRRMASRQAATNVNKSIRMRRRLLVHAAAGYSAFARKAFLDYLALTRKALSGYLALKRRILSSLSGSSALISGGPCLRFARRSAAGS